MKFKYEGNHIISIPEKHCNSCKGCFYEEHNDKEVCTLNKYIKKEYKFSCSEKKSIYIFNKLMDTLKKL